jgi:hypothetical protein
MNPTGQIVYRVGVVSATLKDLLPEGESIGRPVEAG